ncbi:MAG: prepilin-type N-terminal cleavage/methylation domain-containing protein [Lachnospiraceae bacterium]|nr:prepilin-type N-terminal cleavage/methylation domain-containing protein [Lachnospiraceae bacterium]
MKSNEGFSLIELIIVIAIMAVLVAVMAPALSSYIGSAKKRTDISNAKEIENTVTYIVQEALADNESKDVARNIVDNYNERILLVDKLVSDVDVTGQFKEKVASMLGQNEFQCKRKGYNFYIQVIIDETGTLYKVNCLCVKSNEEELNNWSGS